MPPTSVQTVPNRECGACNYCCQHLIIDTEEIQVQPGCLCPNWAEGKGCTIYETRPQVCRGYLCGWRMFAHFDDTWRPDKCGIVITPTNENIPENYPQEGIDFLIVKPDLALAKPDFIPFLATAIRAGIPLFLALRGPAGCLPSRVFLNAALEKPAKNRDEQGFLQIFYTLLHTLQSAEFKPAVFRYSSSLKG